uniref:hypothetical protein n=1 Tax=Nemalion vermiculare TaxID=935621 RepID=UPI00257C9504|nr:hypothetical protein QU266_pgp137 [Nemalion vermiculare]WGV34432.1 hypothetical protein [Nemalion vermiculare]
MLKLLPEISQIFLDNFCCTNDVTSAIVEDCIYCTLYTKSNSQIVIEFYVQELYSVVTPSFSNRSLILFQARSSKKIYELMKNHNMICNKLSSLHGLYIGMELIKAEISVITKQLYCQS